MKKKMMLTAGLLFALFTQNSLFAQNAETDFKDVKGMNLLNVGVGLGSYGLVGTGGIPLTASFEHGFTRNISAGVGLGFIQNQFASDWKYTYLLFGGRGSYHFNEALKLSNPKIDLYAGAGLFYRHASFKYTHGEIDEPLFDFDNSDGDIDFELHAGARYTFSKTTGMFAELGYGISPLQLGLTLKF